MLLVIFFSLDAFVILSKVVYSISFLYDFIPVIHVEIREAYIGTVDTLVDVSTKLLDLQMYCADQMDLQDVF